MVASPKGGEIPIDSNSLQKENVTPDTQKWLDDGEPLCLDEGESHICLAVSSRLKCKTWSSNKKLQEK